jgi:hypothetical protein
VSSIYRFKIAGNTFGAPYEHHCLSFPLSAKHMAIGLTFQLQIFLRFTWLKIFDYHDDDYKDGILI